MSTGQTEITIAGMNCSSCEGKVREALLQVDGVEGVAVDAQAGRALVDLSGEVAEVNLMAAVESAGEFAATAVAPAGAAGGSATAASASPSSRPADDAPGESLYPLFLIVGFIAGVTLLIAYASGDFAIEPMMRHFMAGFFLVFSFFKFLDLAGFASAFRMYDPLAKFVPGWAWLYPFVELGLGVAYLLAWAPLVTNSVTLALMLIGAAGVLGALLQKQAIRCACLGTALNLPMTKVTLVEDLTMAAMAAGMLLLR